MTILPLLLLQAPSADAVLKRAQALHGGMTRVNATLDLTSKQGPGRYEIALNGAQARVRIRRPGDARTAASDREFFMRGKDVIGLDHGTRQWLQARPNVRTGGPAAAFASVTGGFDDAVNYLLSPAAGKQFLEFCRQVKWTASNAGGGQIRLLNAAKNELVFDAQGRLVRLRATNGLLAQYRYLSTPPVTQKAVPSGYQKADLFRDQAPPPRYANAEARRVAERAIRLFDTMPTVDFEVADDDGTVRIRYQNGSLRQDRREASFAAAPKRFAAALHGSKEFLRGSVGRVTASDALRARKIPVDPFVRSLWQGLNPINSLLKPGVAVRSRGFVQTNGQRLDLLEARGRGYVLTLYVRSDGFLSRVDSAVLDENGREVSRSERRFRLRSLRKPIPAGDFTLNPPAGYRTVTVS